MDRNDSFIKMLNDHVNGISAIDIIYEQIPNEFKSLDEIREFIPTVNRQLFLCVSTGFFDPSTTPDKCDKCIKDATIYLHKFIKSVSYSIKLNFDNKYALDFLVDCRNIHGNIDAYILDLLDYNETIGDFIADLNGSYEPILDNSLKLLDLKLKVLIRGVELNNPPFNTNNNDSLLKTSHSVRMSGIFSEYTKFDGQVIYILPEIKAEGSFGVEETKGDDDTGRGAEENSEEGEWAEENSEEEDEPDIAEVNDDIMRQIQEIPTSLLNKFNASPEIIDAIESCFVEQPI